MTSVEQAVSVIRQHGPMTRLQIAETMQWSNTKAAEVIAEARRLALLARISKGDRQQFIFGAVQTVDWPGQARS